MTGDVARPRTHSPAAAADPEQFLHDVSHHVAVVRMLLTALSDQDLPDESKDRVAQLDAQVGVISDLISARTEPAPDDAEACRLDVVVRAVVERTRSTTPLPVWVEQLEGATVALSEIALQRAVTNLCANAVHAATTTQGEVLVRTRVRGRWGFVDVEDSGPGFRATAPAWGVGLGIATEIATAAGGSLEIAARPLGGTRATLRLPLDRTPRGADS